MKPAYCLRETRKSALSLTNGSRYELVFYGETETIRLSNITWRAGSSRALLQLFAYLASRFPARGGCAAQAIIDRLAKAFKGDGGDRNRICVGLVQFPQQLEQARGRFGQFA